MSAATNRKGIGQGKIGPCQGEGADFVRLWIGEEDTFFSPGITLRQSRKRLARERMKGMGDGKARLSIPVIRCS